MGQTWTADTYAAGHVGQTDLQNMETNFLTLKSCFSGAAAPGNTEAGMMWFDTTQKVCKQRNNADSAWLGLMHGDTSQKMWVYRNSAMDGWAVDGTVTDKVLALKGGGTYTTGAATAGSWTLSGLTVDAHTHTGGAHAHGAGTLALKVLGTIASKTIVDRIVSSGGLLYSITTGGSSYSYYGPDIDGSAASGGAVATGAASSSSITSDGTARIAAGVGTLQYLDL